MKGVEQLKKDVLFIMNKLVCGGAEKSLISLLETIDYSKYNVDLFLFKHEGIFLQKIPNEVNLLPEPVNYKFFDMSYMKSFKVLIKNLNLRTAVNRTVLGYLAKTEAKGAVIEQKLWPYLSKSLDKIQKKYDVAIGFQEKNPIYFCVDHVKAKTKIGWIHTDYDKLEVDRNKDKVYFNKLDYLVTVSDELVNNLNKNFPEYKNKIKCIHNIVSSRMIKKLAQEEVNFKDQNNNAISLISVGRLAKEKGLDITLEAFDILVKKGLDINWYLIGEGNVRKELEQDIKSKNLVNRVKFLGVKDNPYPYIRESDIYIQTSRYEGKSISIDEAKILAKPILITNFTTANNHIINGFTGIIADMNSESVATKLEILVKDRELRQKLVKKLKKEEFGTVNEIMKIYDLIKT